MHPGGIIHIHFSVSDASALNFHQSCKGRLRHRVRKHSQVLHSGEALLVIDAHRDQRHAGSHVLEAQVEASLAQVPNLPQLSVQFHLAFTQVPLREALISSNGVNLGVLALMDATAQVGVRLDIVQVESLLAGARHARDAVAVPQGELQLDEDPLAITPGNPACLQPVVLVWLHDIADLVRAYRLVILIHATDFFPLGKEYKGL